MGHTDNYTLLCDFYELTMGNGYFQTGMDQQICYFDVFFRDVPDGGGFAIAAGLEQIIDYIQDLRFSPEDVDFLRGKGVFSEAFLQYLLHFQFKMCIRDRLLCAYGPGNDFGGRRRGPRPLLRRG